VTEPAAPAPRRDFLAQLAAASLASAGLAACAPATRAAAARPAAAPDGQRFDDGWTARVRSARHRAVFDAPEVNDGLALWQAWLFRRGYREALGAEEARATVPVVVIRHAATVLALDDALWAKYKLGETRKVEDPVTKKPAERNVYARRLPDAPAADGEMAAMFVDDPSPTIEGLLQGGAVVLACNMAMRNLINGIARRTNQKPDAVRAELHAGMIPGVQLQPSGIYAVLRAQEAGATYMRSTG
jgi:intracellular sulfur oxidation DsrE/DsrF family protein